VSRGKRISPLVSANFDNNAVPWVAVVRREQRKPLFRCSTALNLVLVLKQAHVKQYSLNLEGDLRKCNEGRGPRMEEQIHPVRDQEQDPEGQALVPQQHTVGTGMRNIEGSCLPSKNNPQRMTQSARQSLPSTPL